MAPACQANSPQPRIADSSSAKAVNFFIRSHNKTLSVAAVRIRNEDRSPLESTAETQPQLQPALLRLSAIIRDLVR
jgi:hypothetical protein